MVQVGLKLCPQRGNRSPAVIRYKSTLNTLKRSLSVLNDIKMNHFVHEVKLETIDNTIAEWENAIKNYSNKIYDLGGTL